MYIHLYIKVLLIVIHECSRLIGVGMGGGGGGGAPGAPVPP